VCGERDQKALTLGRVHIDRIVKAKIVGNAYDWGDMGSSQERNKNETGRKRKRGEERGETYGPARQERVDVWGEKGKWREGQADGEGEGERERGFEKRRGRVVRETDLSLSLGLSCRSALAG
jgi:hypothetical protein